MHHALSTVWQSGLAALVFAAMFLFGERIHPFRALIRDRRTLVSFGSGIAIAYVFLQVMPDLHGARTALVASASEPLPFEGRGIYVLALVGFLLFYGLDHLRARVGHQDPEGHEAASFKVHIASFGAYVWLMAYLLVNGLEGPNESLALYAVAITFHFLAMEHSLRAEHGVAYRRSGRFVLAGMCLLGWVSGQLLVMPQAVLAMLVAFISGGIIMNSSIMELPTEKDGRFLPFLVGGVAYALILLPLA